MEKIMKDNGAVPQMDAIEDLRNEVAQLQRSVEQLKDAVAAQTAYIKILIKNSVDATKVDEWEFPIQSPMELLKMEGDIKTRNRGIFVQKLRKILSETSLSKSIKKVLSRDIISTNNVDGVSGKDGLKTFKTFFPILLEAISLVNPATFLGISLQKMTKEFFDEFFAKNTKHLP
ncbi:uncharacterized protein Dana_GF13858 [Drosophila ananassae]|uniref:DUF4806 domain-containing protein n=1 Tax=Drosophila ananassae TaxID=7217 RepID=B3N256_DROAN|nr:uncharacterized protein Dana_GF13858 [Drosophila ananassae]